MEDTKTGWKVLLGLGYFAAAFGIAGLLAVAVGDYAWWWTLFYGAVVTANAWAIGRLQARRQMERMGIAPSPTILQKELSHEDAGNLRRFLDEKFPAPPANKEEWRKKVIEEFYSAVGKHDTPLLYYLAEGGYPDIQSMRMLTLFARDVRNPETRAGRFLAEIAKEDNKYGIEVPGAEMNLTASIEVLADYSHLETDNFAELFTTVEAANMLGAYMHHREKEGSPEAPAPEREVVGF